ncbi:Uncharacterised protein [Mycobacteroides abscessus subsp. massiliense]|nr:Uncharacterised protein [Mycobacteroides abscessus subsp. massiliense]
MTMSAPPSPNTKPVRFLSNGRDAPAGLSLSVDITMRMLANAAMGAASMAASIPPQMAIAPGVGDAFVTGGTCRDGGDHTTARLALQADDRGRTVGHEHLNGKGGNGFRTPGAHLVIGFD